MKPYEVPIIIIAIVLSIFLLSVAFEDIGNDLFASLSEFLKQIIK